jgi:hypothetical protein
MAETLTTLLAQPVTLESSYAWSVTDQGGAGRTVTIPAGVYRLLLASPSTGAGTVAAPWETLSRFEELINASAGGNVWSFALTAAGLVTITYTGTGTGTLPFDGANVTGKLLGFTGGVSLATGTTATSNYPPTHCVFAFARSGDTGWVGAPRLGAWATMQNSVVYGYASTRARQTRRFDLRLHPTDYAARTALASLATPIYPDDESRVRLPTATPGVDPPWSVHDTIRTAGGQRLGAALGTLQARIAGTGLYDEVYVGAETLTDENATTLSVANWSQRTDWRGVVLNRYRETSSA